MHRKLRILLVEDSKEDKLLIVREIERYGYEVESEPVETAEAMRFALVNARGDVIICDHSLSQFGAKGALKILNDNGPYTPFIIGSETVSEDAAVEGPKAGAHDFVVKHRLASLVSAIEREMRKLLVNKIHSNLQANDYRFENSFC